MTNVGDMTFGWWWSQVVRMEVRGSSEKFEKWSSWWPV